MNANVFTLYRNFNEKGGTTEDNGTGNKYDVEQILDENNQVDENDVESGKQNGSDAGKTSEESKVKMYSLTDMYQMEISKLQLVIFKI